MKYIILFMGIALCSCGKDPLSQSNTDNESVKVDLLFTHDGCKVYRFVDDGRYRYFVKCDNGNTAVSWTECTSAGKTTTCNDIDIPTIKPQ